MAPREAPAPYGLDPFGPSANPAAYVPNEASERVRRSMEAALEVNRSAAVIGPPGHGKTLLLHLIGERQKQRSRVAYVAFSSLDVDEFFAMALEALGRPAGERSRESFGSLVTELGPRGGVTLLVDDAHSMQPDTAQALADIQRGARGDLRLVFAALDGDTTFRVLQRFGKGVDVVSLHGGLSEVETRRYLESRLAYAGAGPELAEAFDDERVAELHRVSQGVPRRLNQAAQELVRRAAPGPMPRLRDLGAQPEPEPGAEGGRELSLAVLAQRVLRGDDAYRRVPEPAAPAAPAASHSPAAPAAAAPPPPARAEPPVEPEPPARAVPPAEPEPPARAEPPAEPEAPARAEVSSEAAWKPPPPLEPRRSPAPAPDAAAARAEAPRPEPTGDEGSGSILEPDPPPADPTPAHRPPQELPQRPPPRLTRPPRREPAPPEGAYRMARDPEAAARRARAAAEFAEPLAAPRVDPRVEPPPAPGFEGLEPSPALWSRQTLVSVTRWMAFGAGVGIAVMWWAGRGAEPTAEPPRPESAAVGAEAAPAPSPPAAAAPGTLTPPAGGEHEALLPPPAAPPRGDPFRRPGLPEQAAVSAEPGAAAPPPGTVPVSINATPWATIEVDGIPLGETPLARVPLAPGPHLFRATFPDGEVREQSVEISQDNRAVSFR